MNKSSFHITEAMLTKPLAKDITKCVEILLIKILLISIALFFLLGSIIIVGEITFSMHTILSLILLILVPTIGTAILCMLFIRVPFSQLPSIKELLYLPESKLFVCNKSQKKYYVKEKYYYIDSIIAVKKYPFVWSITCRASSLHYEGDIRISQYNNHKKILCSLLGKQPTITTIKIGRIYNKTNEQALESLFKTLQD